MAAVKSAPMWLLDKICNESEERLIIIAKTLWGFWFARNRKVWENKQLEPEVAMKLSSRQVTDWQLTQKKSHSPNPGPISAEPQDQVKWHPHDVGKYKLNVDASIYEGQS